MNWPKYVAKISSNAQQKDIARAAGVDGSTVSRWKSGLAPKPENVAAFARSYHRPVLEAFVAAGYLTPEEANEQPTARPSLTELSSDELIHEIARRLKAGEQGERDTSPMNQAGDDADEVTQANRGRLEHGQQPVPNLAEERRRRDQGKGFGHRDQGDLDHENTGTLRPPPSREDAAAYDAPNRGAEAKKKQDQDAERSDEGDE